MRILKILLTFLFALVLAVVALVFFLPGGRIAAIAADQIKAQTGRNLAFDGDVSVSVFPNIGVETGPVSFSNASWSAGGPMFQADGATIGVDLFSLLGGDLRVTEITLNNPSVLLEVNEYGVPNWSFTPESETAEVAEVDNASGGFTVDQLKVLNAQVIYRDQTGGDFDISDLTANFIWGSGPAEIEMWLVPDHLPVEVSARVDDLNALIAGEVTEIALTVKAEGNEVDFSGLASSQPELSGNLNLAMPDPDLFMQALELESEGLPPIDASGAVTLTKENIFSLRGGELQVLGNALSVDADVDLNAKPKVSANVTTNRLDLRPFLVSDEASSTSNGTESGWSQEVIDASALSLFDGTISLSANFIDTGTLRFEGSRVSVAVDNARAVATLHQLVGYEGAVSGEFVMNNRNGLSVGGKMDLAGLSLKPLLTDLVDVESFTGAANAQISFLGSGNSVDKIMNSLSGDGALQIGQGTISGIDLDQLFRGTASGGTTVFDSLNANWTISKGILSNEDLRMELPSVLAKGAGKIGLGAQDIDYTLTPQIRNESETGFSIPVRVKGAWEDPRVWPDVEAVIEQNFQEQVDALEQQATEAVADKLGVTVEEGDDLGKTLEKKLEDEVTKGLKNLLGRN